jgi:aryl sulfotransferase
VTATPERIHEYRNHHLDSMRWDHFRVREGDIVVTTAYKAGTTWTQRILAALLFGADANDRGLMDVSPWVDARFHGPVESLMESLEAQTHRRFVKSHLAADGLRFFPEAKYVVVGRDTRDVFMSLWNHYSANTDLAYSLFNDAERPGAEFPRCPDDPRDLWPLWIGKGWFDWEPDGWPFWSHHHHLSTWWQLRDLPNVHFMHYRDMLADIEGEMRRLAAFCEIDVDEGRWLSIVHAVSLDAMRAEGRRLTEGEDPAAMIFVGGTDRFFYKGTNGRWRDVLTDDDLALYDRAAATLDPELRAWLEGGRKRGHPKVVGAIS